MKDKHYVYFRMIANLLTVLHCEHIMIMKLILQVSLRKEDADRIGDKIADDYNKAFEDVRNDWK